MAWTYLILAGLFEIGWPIGLRFAQYPNFKIIGILIAVACMSLSGYFLFQAQKTIPMGTAYAVWTGIGAAGAFVVGVLFFNEPNLMLRWVGAALIILGVITLKLAH